MSDLNRREEFRLDQITEMSRVSANLLAAIDRALADGLVGLDFADAIAPALEASFRVQYEAEQLSPFSLFTTPARAWEWFIGRIRPALSRTSGTSSARLIADWLGTAVVNGAKIAGTQNEDGKMWLSRRDAEVRPFHQDADGQVVPWGQPFVACDGVEMMFPADPVGPIECWINCRCVAAPAILQAPITAAAHDVLFLENRRTPKVVPKGKRYQPKPSEGRITKRRPATKDEEKVIARGDWLRVNEKGKEPGEPGYMDKKSKIRPGLNAVEGEEFAADPEATGKVIVSIPAADDPIWNASSETKPHMTMIWLGKQEFTEEDWSSILMGVKSAAMEFGDAEGPQELTVTSREPLGDDEADVLMLDAGRMAALRNFMLTHTTIRRAYEAVDQYPQWTPHLTLGYPASPAKGEPGGTIRFDRLAVWDGDYEGEEYPMSVAVEESIPLAPDDEEFVSEPIPWNGVLAPEGIPSGDGRRFAEGALEWRDLPIPLLWQKSNGMGHEGAVIVGQINRIWRDNNLLRGAGFFADSPEADEVIGLYAEGHARGVSVDVDSAEMAVEDEDAQAILFNKGRISAATLCAIPAFAEAYVAIGEWVEPEVDPLPMVASPTGPVTGGEDVPLPFAKMGACGCRGCDTFDCGEVGCSCCWSYDKDDNPVFAPEHPQEALLVDETLAQVASAFDVPDALLGFNRGPGWVTDPVATKRIHDYWTKPGHEGYAKIAWGTPGDFRRLRAQLAKYIGPKYLNRTTAQWHHDALGYWPGEKGKPGNPMAGQSAPALHLVAAGGWCAPAAWFDDPKLDGPTALTIDDEGRIFGHLATWGTCHIGITGVCTEPPESPSNYAYYMTGMVRTAEGTDLTVGQITMGTGHASTAPSVTARQAAAHYDNTGSAVADVRAGRDEFGIWVAGAMRPSATEQQRYELRASGALSGDWRNIGGSLELVAALGVNVPGFPIPRTSLAASGGHQESLVAAGIVGPSTMAFRVAIPDEGSADDVQGLVMAVADEVEARATRRARASALLDDTRALRVAALKDKVEV